MMTEENARMYPLLETVDSVPMELFPYLRETLRP